MNLRRAFSAFLVMSSLILPVLAQQTIKTDDASQAGRDLRIRFLLVSDSLDSPSMRYVRVFLDDRDFTEVNLTRLFRRISDANPTPVRLFIQVDTAWDQLFPKGTKGGQSRVRYHTRSFAHRYASFLRWTSGKVVLQRFNY